MANSTDDIKFKMKEDFKLDAMKSMGWAIDADIPMANEENLKILKEMEYMQELKFELSESIKTYDERDKAIQRHKRNIEAALHQNSTLYTTIKSDVLKEEHLMRMTALERGKLTEDLKNNQKELQEFVGYREEIERKIELISAEIDNMTRRIKSGKTTLLEWTEIMEDGNKGYQLIEKYYKDDQQHARELNTRRQSLQKDIDIRRRRVVELYDEQNTLEKNLERTASLYRAAHLERRQMVETWKVAVNQMTQREKDIQQGEISYVLLKTKAERKALEYAAYDSRLNDIIANNKEVEAVIESLNIDTSDIKEKIQQIIDTCYIKQREMETIQKELQNLNSKVEQQRTENRLLQKEKVIKITEIENFDETLRQVQERLTSMENKNLNANQRLQLLEEMTNGEEKTLAEIGKETERISGLVYRTQRQIFDMTEKEKTQEMVNVALCSTLNALERNSRSLEKEFQRQTEIHYTLAFKMLEAERKLATLQGSIIDPEVEERNQEHLTELETTYVKLQRLMQVTEGQNKKLNYSMNTMVNAFNNDNKDLEKVKFNIKEAQVYCVGTVKRLKESQSQNQELIVELSLLKMRCSDMELEIEKCEKGQFNLDKYRLEMQRAAKDRMVELKSQNDILSMKRKHLCEELSTLRADLGERKKHIEAMRARFELTARLLGTNDDGTLVTTTQLKVESAQQKQILADEGDELNKKVINAEQEVVALENTLRMFDKSNDNYRRNFQKDDDATRKAAEDLKQLQIDYCQELNTLKIYRCKAGRFEAQLAKLHEQYENDEKQLQVKLREREEAGEILHKINRDIQIQNGKISRADRDIRYELKRIKRLAISEEFMNAFNRDLFCQELQQRNMRALSQLTDAALADSSCKKIMDLLCAKGLKLPQHLKAARSILSFDSDETNETMPSCSVLSTDRSSSNLSVVSLNFPEDTNH